MWLPSTWTHDAMAGHVYFLYDQRSVCTLWGSTHQAWLAGVDPREHDTWALERRPPAAYAVLRTWFIGRNPHLAAFSQL